MNRTISRLVYLLMLLILLSTGCKPNSVEQVESLTIENSIPSAEITIRYFDVGQADCALVETDNHFMLIDAACSYDDGEVVELLKDEGVTEIDYLIATHPHSDHINSMDKVVNSFEIGQIYMPKKTHNTRIFQNTLNAIQNKGLNVTTPISGDKFFLGDLPVEIIGPVKDYNDLNNDSIVLKISNGDIDFLFTGDIEGQAESDILDAGYDVSAEVLKVAHHGSDTSSTIRFLDAVSPEFAVISVGTDNSYGHPDESTLSALREKDIPIYRTDQFGTVTIKADGESLSVNTEKDILEEESKLPLSVTEGTYIGNKNSLKLHTQFCDSLPQENNRVYFDSNTYALDEGYVPCKRCKP